MALKQRYERDGDCSNTVDIDFDAKQDSASCHNPHCTNAAPNSSPHAVSYSSFSAHFQPLPYSIDSTHTGCDVSYRPSDFHMERNAPDSNTATASGSSCGRNIACDCRGRNYTAVVGSIYCSNDNANDPYGSDCHSDDCNPG